MESLVNDLVRHMMQHELSVVDSLMWALVRALYREGSVAQIDWAVTTYRLRRQQEAAWLGTASRRGCVSIMRALLDRRLLRMEAVSADNATLLLCTLLEAGQWDTYAWLEDSICGFRTWVVAALDQYATYRAAARCRDARLQTHMCRFMGYKFCTNGQLDRAVRERDADVLAFLAAEPYNGFFVTRALLGQNDAECMHLLTGPCHYVGNECNYWYDAMEDHDANVRHWVEHTGWRPARAKLELYRELLSDDMYRYLLRNTR